MENDGQLVSLAPGETYSGQCSKTWTAQEGDHNLVITADDVNRFSESNESNSSLSHFFVVDQIRWTVTPSVLGCGTVTPDSPQKVVDGQSITFNLDLTGTPECKLARIVVNGQQAQPANPFVLNNVNGDTQVQFDTIVIDDLPVIPPQEPRPFDLLFFLKMSDRYDGVD